MEIKLPQKSPGLLLVKGYNVVGGGFMIVNLGENAGSKTFAAAAGAFLNAGLIIRHWDHVSSVYHLYGLMVMENSGSKAGREENERCEEKKEMGGRGSEGCLKAAHVCS